MTGGSRLAQLARRDGPVAPEPSERCDLCGAPLPGEHRHVLDVDTREIRCACRACALLFDRPGAGGGRLRLIGDRRLRLAGFELTDAAWDALRIPVDTAFFLRSSAAERVLAYYPGPMGATESLLGLAAWAALDPVLGELEPDVEALLVKRGRGCWIVPIEDPYRLVAVIRSSWRGLTGGREAWAAIGGFFDELDRRAKETRWPSLASAR